MSILSEDDHDTLDLFLGKVLELHKAGVLTTEDAIGHLAQVIGAIDLQSHEAHSYMSNVLSDVWNPDA